VESYSVGLVWDDRLCAAVDDIGAEVIAIIALVSDEGAHRWRKRKKGRRGLGPGRE
jgi:hypothetical protein